MLSPGGRPTSPVSPSWGTTSVHRTARPHPSLGLSHEKADWHSHQSAPNLASEKTGVQTERLPAQGAERGLGAGPGSPHFPSSALSDQPPSASHHSQLQPPSPLPLPCLQSIFPF